MEIKKTFQSCTPIEIVQVVASGTDTHVLSISVPAVAGGGSVAVGGAGNAPNMAVPAAGNATTYQVKPPGPGAITLHWTSSAQPPVPVEITYEYT